MPQARPPGTTDSHPKTEMSWQLSAESWQLQRPDFHVLKPDRRPVMLKRDRPAGLRVLEDFLYVRSARAPASGGRVEPRTGMQLAIEHHYAVDPVLEMIALHDQPAGIPFER